MIDVRELRFAYPHRNEILREIDCFAGPGSIALLVGDSGSGKSTLLRCLNGLIPHFHGGRFGGEVSIAGLSTRSHTPRDLAARVGTVFQDPEAQVVTDKVVDEIVFALEQLGTPRDEMRHRLNRVVEQLGIGRLLDQETATLSGGERQLVVLAGALVVEPQLLVMDEPTSQLDDTNARRLLDTVEHLARDRHLTVVISEHRLERVRASATDILLMDEGRLLSHPSSEFLPSTAYDASAVPASHSPATVVPGDTLLRAVGVSVVYDGTAALESVDVEIGEGEVLAVTGPNGSGKTTLLRALAGIQSPAAGAIERAGSLSGRRLAVGYVPQNPTSILHQETLIEELLFTLRAGQLSGDIQATLASLGIESHAERHPLDLSGGERQRAAIAAIVVGEPKVLLLDEPTRGLPFQEKLRLADFVRGIASEGRAVVVATHDDEFVKACATREMRLADGRLAGERRLPATAPLAVAAYAFDG